ncbi:undecaprenyl-phosphate glucose phosphotransferase [Burkholderia cenocepacia]|uniref:Undecaprenyl-phosphate glucose phosphotransferase n=1 Tax=Burkholderia cenocepacia TaxID=95486 RepID=A0A1V2W0X1_9BURK|nr:undecaprenyl-phosphate glucose phosphotransferase [Burkholderia cenocepacia]MBR8247299.1 undecaprenyl-phosphate glucose phosphotransferase [Burkholderia cenocepacia]MBR8285272.1 undecaprenyl-phosphate glucose phosphotransferase [Burkholderia cenocepacia]MBR8496416.1 undecaprenyl-phosphate glucose phosphotransferase [Burkholderia cenocepacia]ONI98527.1 undecaprenyl-phosphate glucose phosphotransferase [Burkholderia cenocepacia]ONJ21105.1 undecaprenyl-phosphate glucose phosphotransferase [Bur
MKTEHGPRHEIVVCAVDVAVIVAIAAATHRGSLGSLATLRTESLLVGVSALLAAFLLRLAGIGLDGRPHPAMRYALRTLALWLVVQGFVFVKLLALTTVTMLLLTWFFDWTVGVAIVLVLFRIALSIARRRSLRVPATPARVAVVGDSARIARLTDALGDAASHYRIVGACETIGDTLPPAALALFVETVRREHADEIWIALPLDDDATITRVIDEFRHDFVELRLMPDVSKHALFGSRIEEILGEPTISLAVPPLSRGALAAKAVFDRLFATVVLITLMPLLLAIAVAIRLTSAGPVLFTQKRRGADGRTFDIYKFRTMRVHAPSPGTVVQAKRNDPRVTKVGAFLRRTSLDELPQFINVLFGDMSVVGPRPHAVEHDAQYRTLVDGYIHRYRIKPGITGWAQVNGLRGATEQLESMQSRVEYDLYYLRNWSFALDLRIIGATVLKGIVHPNAY